MEVPWELPVMQAPIGPATTLDLVVAVSRAGALGTLAASWTDVAELRGQLRGIRAALEAPFCVNLVLAFDQRERLQVSLEEGVGVVSFSWGIDDELIKCAHEAGAVVLIQVGSAEEAVHASKAGADVLIAQGIEAGGHVQGSIPTFQLVRELRSTGGLPLVAAGGIGDDVSLRRAMEAGADAVACGTAFLAAHEADVHPHYLDRLLYAEGTDTVLTSLFDGGWPDAAHRVIRNETLTQWEAAGKPSVGARPGEGMVVANRRGKAITRYSDAQPTTETTGDIEAMAMYAGSSASSVTRSEAAATIARRLAAGLD